MSFSTQGAVGGGVSGAAIGAKSGGGWGALAGAFAGGALGGFLGGPQQQGFTTQQLEDFYTLRMHQIKQFNSEYLSSINDYQNKATNLATQTFSKFYAPGVMASLAATGFSPESGAVATGLANTSEQMQAGLFNNVFNANQNRLSSVNSARSAASSALMGAAGPNVGVPQTPAWLQGLGNLGGMALYSMWNNNNKQPDNGMGEPSGYKGPIDNVPTGSSSMNGMTGYYSPNGGWGNSFSTPNSPLGITTQNGGKP